MRFLRLFAARSKLIRKLIETQIRLIYCTAIDLSITDGCKWYMSDLPFDILSVTCTLNITDKKESMSLVFSN